MIDSPLIDELVAERSVKLRQRYILRVLTVRFGDLPEGLDTTLKMIVDEGKLDELHDYAARSPDVEAFTEYLRRQHAFVGARRNCES